MHVLITGGNGTVGTAITDHLGDDGRFEFTVLDLETDRTSASAIEADVTDREAIRPHFAGQDAVIHLALIPGLSMPGEGTVGWTAAHAANLEGLHNVLACAIEADLDRLIFASSNHAVGMVEVQHRPEVYHDEGVVAGHDEPHRPDSLYGLTKAYGEDLGRFAGEVHGIRVYGKFGANASPFKAGMKLANRIQPPTMA